MLIFWDQRLVILATPKTGSTAIGTALDSLASITVDRPPTLKHTPVYRYRRYVQPWLERSAGGRFTVVALMREPLSWLGSWYRYRSRDDIAGTAQSTSAMGFDDFLDAYMRNPRPPHADVGSQARFLGGPDGAGRSAEGAGVDLLFRYERIGAFVAFLEDRLDCVIELPRVNVSPQGDLALAPETQARIRAHCAADYALYEAIPEGPIRAPSPAPPAVR